LPALHCFWFGVHALHSPPLHGVGEQFVPFVHKPVALHDCTVLPEQRFAMPGAHSPPQSCFAASQTNVQAVGAPHLPIASHASTRVVDPAEQRVAPGRQSPVHAPAAQAVVHAACVWFVPVASQRMGVLLAPQLLVPGLHIPVHAVVASEPVHANGHVVVSCQKPCRSHCWMTAAAGLQRFTPAVQRKMQAPVAVSQTGLSFGQAS